MKFIFPQNYAFKNKLFGFIDYSTLVLNIVWDSFIFCVLDILITNVTFKLSLLIVFCFPLLLFSIIGFNHENFLNVLVYLFKFIKTPKIYFYSKNN
jgi:hypothetical protein